MTKPVSEQIQHLLENHAAMKAKAPADEAFSETLKTIASGKEPGADDLMKISLAYDINLKSLLAMHYMPEAPMTLKAAERCLQNKDLPAAVFLACTCIVRKDNAFYMIPHGVFSEEYRIRESTMDRLRIFLLENGLPLTARSVSCRGSFCPPETLEKICTPKEIRTYMFGALADQAPCIDRLSAALFNRLDEEKKSAVLRHLKQVYTDLQGLNKTEIYDDLVWLDNSGELIVLWKAEFDDLETDDPIRDELIELENKLFV